MALLHSAVMTTLLFQLVLACYLLDVAYSATTAAAAGTAGGACLTNTDKCPNQGLVCENNTCKFKHGSDCSTHTDLCVYGATCQTTGTSQNCSCDPATFLPTLQGLCAAITTTSTTTTTPAIPTTTVTEAINVGSVGSVCSRNATTVGGCVQNALCLNQRCACTSNYYVKSNNRCGIKIGTNEDCHQKDENCVDHAICNYTLTTPSTGSGATTGTCECGRYYFKDANGACTLRRTAGSACNYNASDMQGTCTPNAECNSNSKCQCKNDSYMNSTYFCLDRIQPGYTCSPTSDGDNCISGAHCSSNHTCQCIDPEFRLSDRTCMEVKQVGEECPAGTVCTKDAHCNTTTHTCECNADFFFNSIEEYCQLRKSLDDVCNTTEECILNAECTDSICQCNRQLYYNQNHRCNPRLELNHECDPSVPNQCLELGECVNGICQCDRSSFKSGVICKTTIRFGDTCVLDVSDPRQCESNTTCGFHPDQDTPHCGCDVNHFFNGEYCVKRAAAGDSCPYASNSSLGLAIPYAEFLRQCVENAHCNELFEICECNPEHYDRNGRCPKQIGLHGVCDPWTNYPHQCGNLQCLHGRCVPLQ